MFNFWLKNTVFIVNGKFFWRYVKLMGKVAQAELIIKALIFNAESLKNIDE